MTDTPSSASERPTEVPDLTVAHAVQPFYLDRAPVRGRLIRLGPLAHAMLSRHHALPDDVKKLGGEGVALVAAMATALKFKGSLSLQIKGNGPVALFLVDCTDNGELRFTAQMNEKFDGPLPHTAKALLGEGYIAFTIDQGPHTERHQGITNIEGESLADIATHYFATSEQHPCSLHLFSQKTKEGWQAGGLVLERIAGEGGHAHNDDTPASAATDNEDLWETSCTFARTLKAEEIFNPELSSLTLINRLFGSLNVHATSSRSLSFGCRCSKERMLRMLSQFSEEDLNHMAQDGEISITCHFCNTHFVFPRENLFPASPST